MGYWTRKKVDWTSKPPLGTPLRSDGHWGVEGLAGAWAFNEGAGATAFDSVGHANATLKTAAFFNSNGLQCVDAAGGHAITGQGTTPSQLTGPQTVIARASRPEVGAAAYEGLYSVRYTTAPVSLRTGEGPSIQCAWISSNGAAVTPYIVGGFPYDAVCTVGYVFDGVGVKLYSSAKPSGDANDYKVTATATRYIDTTAQIGLGGDARFFSTGVYSSNINLQVVLVHSRALSASEIASLSANPWQIYEPEIKWVWVEDGGTPTFKPFWALQSNQIIQPGAFL